MKNKILKMVLNLVGSQTGLTANDLESAWEDLKTDYEELNKITKATLKAIAKGDVAKAKDFMEYQKKILARYNQLIEGVKNGNMDS